MKDPRTVHLADRVKARGGEVVYDGDRRPIAFRRAVQDRIDREAKEWDIPRSAMIRWLVDSALEKLDRSNAAKARLTAGADPTP